MAIKLGKYELKKKLGEGASSTVYLAYAPFAQTRPKNKRPTARVSLFWAPPGNQAWAMPSSSFCSSPAWYISFMMSQPPMNSPLI